MATSWMQRWRVAGVAVWLIVVPVLGIGSSVEPTAAVSAERTASVGGGAVTNFPNNISGPASIVTGPDGALWYTNKFGSGSIGRITIAGVITVFTDPGIRSPGGITVGPDGALWFTNQGNDSIGRITTAGAVTNFTDPSMSGPNAITTGPDGALWYTNQFGSSIGRITTSGVVTNFTDPAIKYPDSITAGPDGALWFTNGFGTSTVGRITMAGAVAAFSDRGIENPAGITLGPDGALWFTNADPSSVGRITTAGVVTKFTDPTIISPVGITAGPDRALWFTNQGNDSIGRITTGGAVTNFTDASINAPTAIATGPDSALWFTNQNGSSIGRLTTSGVFTDHAGSRMANPFAITSGPDGALWFTNHSGESIGRIGTDGAITRYTGPGVSRPAGITTGPDGALWFTNQGNSSIGRITTAGTITNYRGDGINVATGITAGPDGALWFTNQGNDSIGRITTAGTITNYRGAGVDVPIGITVGPDRALWFTNRGGDSIGRITVKGRVTHYTGPRISRPFGIVNGPDGALWFTNQGNDSIGRISPSGRVSHFTGTGIDGPAGIARRSDGALWFANKGNGSIGRITTTGRVSNFTDPTINGPIGIVAGPDGAMWFTNYASNSLGRIGSVTPSSAGSNRAPPPSPIVDVAPGPDLSCATSGTRSDWLQFFEATFVGARSCATVVAVDGVGLFGPPSFGDSGGAVAGTTLLPYEPVSQTTIRPSAANGWKLTVDTVVRLPRTALLLRQRDTYVTGSDSVRTSVSIDNVGGIDRDVVVYRTGDCFPGSDLGFGISRGNTVGCEQAVQDGLNAVLVAGPVYMRWSPEQGASTYQVAAVDDLRAAIGGGAPLDDSCACSTPKDIAASLSWSLHLAPGTTETVAHRLTYSVTAGRHAAHVLAGTTRAHRTRRLTARVTSGGQPIARAPVEFVIGSLSVCTAVTDRSGVASCPFPRPVPGFVARYTGDTSYRPANGNYTPRHAPPPPADPPGFPACGHFDRAGVTLVSGGDAHSVTVLSTTGAPPCPVVQYTAYGDGVEIGEMRGDLRATDLFGRTVPGMALLHIDAPYGSQAASCVYLTATDSRTGAVLDTNPGPDEIQCIFAVGGQKYR